MKRRARFFGGLLNGETREVAGAHRQVRLAAVDGGYVKETYIRDGHSGAGADIVLHYRLESSQDATAEFVEADRENRERALAMLGEDCG